jgi:ATP-dependent helicase HrpB
VVKKFRLENDESRFPIDAVTDEVLEALALVGVCVVVAPPGAGKTTRLPLAILDAPWNDGEVIVTQPRRLAARTAAERLAATIGDRIGETVGLRTGEETKVGPHSRLTVVTEGVLARMLQSDPYLDGISAVLIDEVHERSLSVDLCLAFLREVRDSVRPDLRLLLLSATLDEARFGQVFNAPVVKSEGRSFPLERIWEPALVARYPEFTADVVIRELASLDLGEAVLVFTPGRREIEMARRQLERRLGSAAAATEILTLHGGSARSDVHQVLAAPSGHHKRVVLATNIAQTSLTLPGVRVVIDQGLVRRSVSDASTGFSRLQTVRVSRSTATQRAGRAGRLGPGRAIALWSQTQEATLADHDEPEIHRADVTDVVLAAVGWGARAANALSWVDEPTVAAWDEAITTLRELDAVDDNIQITAIGTTLSQLPVSARLGRLAIAASSLAEPLRSQGLALVALLSSDRREGRDVTLAEEVVRLADELQSGKPTSEAGKTARRLQAALTEARHVESAASSLGGLFSLALPARIASRHPTNPGLYTLASGVRLPIGDDDPLRGETLLVVTELDANTVTGRIFSALPITADEVLRLHGHRSEHRTTTTVIDGCLNGHVQSVSTVTIGAATITERRNEPTLEALGAAVRASVSIDEIGSWLDGTPLAPMESRLAFLRSHHESEHWPNLSPAGLWETRETWLFPTSATRPLRSVDPIAILSLALSRERRIELERRAPAAVLLPTNREVMVDYSAEAGPTVRAKLQEFLGTRSSPTVDGVRCVVELLTPAGKVAAITDDLARFWEVGYGQVRAELRGRYPKHDWPADPLSATAQTGTKAAEARKAAPAISTSGKTKRT